MSDLTTLASVKQWLNLASGSTSDDALLSALITAYSEYIQTYINREFASATYSDNWDGSGGSFMLFPNYPVTAVSSLSIDDISIPFVTNTTDSGYRFDKNRIWLNNYLFNSGMGNIAVTYTAGYASVPPEIARATVELVGLRYREKDRIGMSSKTLAGEITAFITKDFPDSVKTILNNYRKVAPF